MSSLGTAENLYVDEFSDDYLIQIVDQITLENEGLRIENFLFECYFMRQDPTIMTAVDRLFELALSGKSNQLGSFGSVRSAGVSSTRQIGTSSIMAASRSQARAGGIVGAQKVTFPQRLDFAKKEIEFFKVKLYAIQEQSGKRENSLKCYLEEINLRENELSLSKEKFHERVTSSADLVSNKIYAEAWLKFMNEWLLAAESLIGRIRLELSTLKLRNKNLKLNLIRKEYLGKSLRPIDFQKIGIENQEYMNSIEESTLHIVNVKKMIGAVHNNYNVQKSILNTKTVELDNVKKLIIEREKQTKSINKDLKTLHTALRKYEKKVFTITDGKSTEPVPKLISYINVKGDALGLQNMIKGLSRRKSAGF